jgi:hypothetical protein
MSTPHISDNSRDLKRTASSQAIVNGGPRSVADPVHRMKPVSGRVVEWFIILEILCQLALLTDSFKGWRLILRIAPFATSLFLLVAIPRGSGRHRASSAAFLVIAILALELLHPDTDGYLDGIAQIAMYTAIISPLFWAARLNMDEKQLGRIVTIMWMFGAVSATIGLLQVYSPNLFPPALSSIVMAKSVGYRKSLQFTNAFGQNVFRPSGLTDLPGGVAMSGLYAALFATALLLTSSSSLMVVAVEATTIVAVAAIYLSQVRSVLIVLLICMMTLIAVLWRRATLPGRMTPGQRQLIRKRFSLLVATVLASSSIGLFVALNLGGRATQKRFDSLTENSATQVYSDNRGLFLRYTVEELLPEYPLGAGLARWGMMRLYFGDESNPNSPAIYSEIQWTGWLLDGGIPLIIAYVVAVMMAMSFAYRTSLRTGEPRLGVWSALVFAYSVGAVADCFDGHFFMSQQGLDFWMLQGLLFAVTSSATFQQFNSRRSIPS